jgi:hypothetical protein
MDKYSADSRFLIRERWFPGCHYDVGRAKFKFFRDGVNVVEKFFFTLPNKLTEPVAPNLVCSNLVLLWVYKLIFENDASGNLTKQGIATDIQKTQALLSGTLDVGSGDVYGDLERHIPGGRIASAISHLTGAAVKVLDTITATAQLGSAIQDFLGVKTILNILVAIKDRRIEDINTQVVDLSGSLGQTTVDVKAELARYQSSTEVKWKLVKRIVGNTTPPANPI